jgi:hypothetical protein
MKKIIKHYPMTDRLIVRRGYVFQEKYDIVCKTNQHYICSRYKGILPNKTEQCTRHNPRQTNTKIYRTVQHNNDNNRAAPMKRKT